jgi:hypothetical protein
MSLSNIKLLISKYNLVILYQDWLEEGRSLYIQEANFKRIVKIHYEYLLRIQY